MSATKITRLLELTFIQRHICLKRKKRVCWGSGCCGLTWCSNHLSVYPAVHVSYSFLFAHHPYERLLGKYICTTVPAYYFTTWKVKGLESRLLIEERQGYWLMIHSWKQCPISPPQQPNVRILGRLGPRLLGPGQLGPEHLVPWTVGPQKIFFLNSKNILKTTKGRISSQRTYIYWPPNTKYWTFIDNICKEMDEQKHLSMVLTS